MRGQGRRVRVLDLVVCFLYPYFLPFIAFSFLLRAWFEDTETERGGNFFPVLDTRREGNKGRDERKMGKKRRELLVILLWSYLVIFGAGSSV
jgi:hypothetical protein